MLTQDQPFLLFESCKVVKGFKRSIICDTQRNDFDFIPNILAYILNAFQGKTIQEVKAKYHFQQDECIEEYFSFLWEKEYLFFTNQPTAFPKLENTFESPALIENAILDIDANSEHNYSLIFEQLDSLLCNALQIRSYVAMSMTLLESILSQLKYSGIRIVELLLPYTGADMSSGLTQLCQKFPRLTNLFVYNAPQSEVLQLNVKTHLYFSPQSIPDEQCCGVISPLYFSLSMATFLEAQRYNTCLHKKISIDRKGWIKNCPSMPTHYGSIASTRLEEVVQKARFREFWEVTKDQTAVCKDCEFRYVCTDCRAYAAPRQGQLYGKPAKCSYNPYEAKWE